MRCQGEDTTSQTLDFRISTPPLYWSRDAGVSQRNVTILLPPELDTSASAIMVQLVNASNADISDSQGACYVTGLASDQLVSTFTLVPNQVGCNVTPQWPV